MKKVGERAMHEYSGKKGVVVGLITPEPRYVDEGYGDWRDRWYVDIRLDGDSQVSSYKWSAIV